MKNKKIIAFIATGMMFTIIVVSCDLSKPLSSFSPTDSLTATQVEVQTSPTKILILPTEMQETMDSKPIFSTQTPQPSVDQQLRVGSLQTSSIDAMEMVYIPAGSFSMGSALGKGSADEHPQHSVSLHAFWMDRSEITNKMYQACVLDGACSLPDDLSSATRSEYFSNDEFSSYPVIHVTWQDAFDYCKWARRRLPTEAEWEKAARGPDGFTYVWGNDSPSCEKANFAGCYGDTQPVRSDPLDISGYGVFDMLGNVWEWVADYYGENYYEKSPPENPAGPVNGNKRSLRGGSWYTYGNYLTNMNRLGDTPDSSDSDYGFRCALDISN